MEGGNFRVICVCTARRVIIATRSIQSCQICFSFSSLFRFGFRIAANVHIIYSFITAKLHMRKYGNILVFNGVRRVVEK